MFLGMKTCSSIKCCFLVREITLLWILVPNHKALTYVVKIQQKKLEEEGGGGGGRNHPTHAYAPT